MMLARVRFKNSSLAAFSKLIFHSFSASNSSQRRWKSIDLSSPWNIPVSSLRNWKNSLKNNMNILLVIEKEKENMPFEFNYLYVIKMARNQIFCWHDELPSDQGRKDGF